MPLYEFVCRECDHPFEKLVSPSKDEPVSCPACRGSDVERVLSVVSVGRSSGAPQPSPLTCEGCPGRGKGDGCPVD